MRISRGADGKYRRTIRAPGTGIYDIKVIGGSSKPQRSNVASTARPRKQYSAGENAVGSMMMCAISIGLLVWAISSGGWIWITLAVLFLLFWLVATIGFLSDVNGEAKSDGPSVPVILMEPTMEGWHPDPYEPTRQRWWNGSNWTTETRSPDMG